MRGGGLSAQAGALAGGIRARRVERNHRSRRGGSTAGLFGQQVIVDNRSGVADMNDRPILAYLASDPLYDEE